MFYSFVYAMFIHIYLVLIFEKQQKFRGLSLSQQGIIVRADPCIQVG